MHVSLCLRCSVSSFPSCVRKNSCRVLIRCSFRKFSISRSEKREEVMFRTAGGWGAEAGGCYVVLVVTLGLIFIIREKQQLQKRLLCCGDGNWAALNIKVLYKMKEEEWFTALRPLALFVRVKHRLVSRVGACALPARSVAPGVWVRSWASNFWFPRSASAVEQRNIQRAGAHPGRSCAVCLFFILLHYILTVETGLCGLLLRAPPLLPSMQREKGNG